jgi:hypothetical protein
LTALFEPHASSVASAQRHFVFRYRSAAHFIEVFKTYYGPVLKAFAALPSPEQSALEKDLQSLVAEFNRSGDGSMVAPSEYLEIMITRR